MLLLAYKLHSVPKAYYWDFQSMQQGRKYFILNNLTFQPTHADLRFHKV